MRSASTLLEVIDLMDEGERKALGDPVRQCLTTGGRVHLGRRGMVVSGDGEGERSIELTVSPLRDAAGELVGHRDRAARRQRPARPDARRCPTRRATTR